MSSTQGKGVAEQGASPSTGGITASSSVSEVVELLKTTFRKMLSDRENAVKAEIEILRKANESAQKVREMEKFEMRRELQGVKKENMDLIENLKQEMEELKAEKKGIEERVKGYEGKYGWLDRRLALLETNVAYVAVRLSKVENEKENDGDNGVVASATQNHHLGPKEGIIIGSSSKAEKNGVEERLKAYEEKYGLLNERLGRMERNVAYVAVKLSNLENDGNRVATFATQNHLGSTPKVGASSSRPNKEAPWVVLSDGEDEMAVDKCEAMGAGGKSTTASDLNLKPQKEVVVRDENEMRLAFANDLELCMSGVCALYRKIFSVLLTLKPVAMDRGFDSKDNDIGVKLAKYLIANHPDNKLSKSMSEISEAVAKECIRLALKYSDQLFRIYSSGEDPLFCRNSTTTSKRY